MKAIDILKAISIECLGSENFGIAEGSDVNLLGFFSYFGYQLEYPFPLDEGKLYFYYYGEKDEKFMRLPIDDAFIFYRGEDEALYIWPID